MPNSTLEASDKPRLARQLDRIREMMLYRDRWWTLEDIRCSLFNNYLLAASEAGISARLRQLRSMGYLVERRKRGKTQYEYKVTRAVADGRQAELFPCNGVAGSSIG